MSISRESRMAIERAMSSYISVNLSTHSFPISNLTHPPELWRHSTLPEIYTGIIIQHTMHDIGTYKWYKGDDEYQYEGKFYANNMHGYGRLTYPDNSVFEGLFYKNRRFGPGVSKNADGTQDVGIWKGTRLVRLIQMVAVNEPVPVLAKSAFGKKYLLHFRELIDIEKDYEDYAKELLEDLNAPDEVLNESELLYSEFIRNPNSIFFNHKLFHDSFFSSENEYVVKIMEPLNETSTLKTMRYVKIQKIFAWNNESLLIEIMKYTFLNRIYEDMLPFKVNDVITGRRSLFESAGQQERYCLHFLYACASDNEELLKRLIYKHDLYPNLTDCAGNNGVLYAAVNNQSPAIRILTNFGANLNNLNDECLTALQLSLLRYIAFKFEVSYNSWEAAFLPAQSPFPEYPVEYQQWPPTGDAFSDTDRLKRTMTKSHLRLFKTPGRSSESGRKMQSYLFDLSCVIPGEHKLKIEDDRSSKGGKTLNKKTIKSEAVVADIIENDEYNKLMNENMIKITETILTLLQCGASPNVGKLPCCPLLTSLFTRSPEIVQYLIQFGANIHVQTSYETGSLSPLHVIASLAPCVELAQMAAILLQAGANVNEVCNTKHWVTEKLQLQAGHELHDDGKTPMHLLCMRYDFVNDTKNYLCNLASTFIVFQSDLNLCYSGHTPLSLAILRGNINLIECLLSTGLINPNGGLMNNMGVPLTVLTLDRYKNCIPIKKYKQVLNTLLKFHANPLNTVPNFEGNAIEFSIKENKIYIPEKKKKPAKEKSRTTPAIKALYQSGQEILMRYIQGRVVKMLYNYRIECGFDDNIFEIIVKFLDFNTAIEILQNLMDAQEIISCRIFCIEFLKYIGTRLQMKKKNQKKKKKQPILSFDDTIEGYVNKLDFDMKQEPHKQGPFEVCSPEMDPNADKYIVCFECLQKIEKELMQCPVCMLVYFCSQKCNIANNKNKASKHPCKIIFYDNEKLKSEQGSLGLFDMYNLFESSRNELLLDPNYFENLLAMNSVEYKPRLKYLFSNVPVVRDSKRGTVQNLRFSKIGTIDKGVRMSMRNEKIHKSGDKPSEKSFKSHKRLSRDNTDDVSIFKVDTIYKGENLNQDFSQNRRKESQAKRRLTLLSENDQKIKSSKLNTLNETINEENTEFKSKTTNTKDDRHSFFRQRKQNLTKNSFRTSEYQKESMIRRNENDKENIPRKTSKNKKESAISEEQIENNPNENQESTIKKRSENKKENMPKRTSKNQKESALRERSEDQKENNPIKISENQKESTIKKERSENRKETMPRKTSVSSTNTKSRGENQKDNILRRTSDNRKESTIRRRSEDRKENTSRKASLITKENMIRKDENRKENMRRSTSLGRNKNTNKRSENKKESMARRESRKETTIKRNVNRKESTLSLNPKENMIRRNEYQEEIMLKRTSANRKESTIRKRSEKINEHTSRRTSLSSKENMITRSENQKKSMPRRISENRKERMIRRKSENKKENSSRRTSLSSKENMIKRSNNQKKNTYRRTSENRKENMIRNRSETRRENTLKEASENRRINSLRRTSGSRRRSSSRETSKQIRERSSSRRISESRRKRSPSLKHRSPSDKAAWENMSRARSPYQKVYGTPRRKSNTYKENIRRGSKLTANKFNKKLDKITIKIKDFSSYSQTESPRNKTSSFLSSPEKKNLPKKKSKDKSDNALEYLEETKLTKVSTKPSRKTSLADPNMSKLMCNLRVNQEQYEQWRQERRHSTNTINDEFKLILCEEFDYKFWQMFMPFCIYIDGQLYYKFQNDNNVFCKLDYTDI